MSDLFLRQLNSSSNSFRLIECVITQPLLIVRVTRRIGGGAEGWEPCMLWPGLPASAFSAMAASLLVLDACGMKVGEGNPQAREEEGNCLY